MWCDVVMNEMFVSNIAVVWTYVCCRVLLPHDVGSCCCRWYCIDVPLCGDMRWQRRGGVRMIVAGLMMWGDVVVVHEVDCHVVDRGG